MNQNSFLYKVAFYLCACATFGALTLAAIAVMRSLNIGFLFALLITVLSVHYARKIFRLFKLRFGRSFVKTARAKWLADNKAAKQPAMRDFEEALGNRQAGIALIRTYPARNLPYVRSRIGGQPDLPKSFAWPRVDPETDRRVAKGGNPLHFLAQLDFSELPRIDPRLPPRGTLLFFAHLDEELGWSGSKNSVRVLFDPRSEGSRICPPDSITPVFDGTDESQDRFGIEGDFCTATLHEWQLIATIVETVPGPAFSPTDTLYPALLRQRSIIETEYLISQLKGKVSSQFEASVVHIYDLGWTIGNTQEGGTMPTKLAFEELFCHLRLCELLVRRLINFVKRDERNSHHLIASGNELLNSILHSNGEATIHHLPLEAWIADIVKTHNSGVDFSRALADALLQFVAEHGGVGVDTSHIHEKIFAFAATAHVLKRPDWGMRSSDDDDCIAFFHQCLGHVWTAQGQPTESDENLCLLHLKSDYGLRLLICDVGGIQFWITKKDLAAGNFLNVWATTQGY